MEAVSYSEMVCVCILVPTSYYSRKLESLKSFTLKGIFSKQQPLIPHSSHWECQKYGAAHKAVLKSLQVYFFQNADQCSVQYAAQKKVEFSITSQQMPGIMEEGSFKTNIICATNEILMIEWEAVCCDLCLQSFNFWD